MKKLTAVYATDMFKKPEFSSILYEVAVRLDSNEYNCTLDFLNELKVVLEGEGKISLAKRDNDTVEYVSKLIDELNQLIEFMTVEQIDVLLF